MNTARYAELFLSESREHLSVVNESLLQLERGLTPADAVRDLFRAVHSMKGMAAAMGYAGVADLAHEMESLLDGMRTGAQLVDGERMDALFAAADLLGDAVGAAIGGADGSVDCTAILERLRALSGAAVDPAAAAPASPARDGAATGGLREATEARTGAREASEELPGRERDTAGTRRPAGARSVRVDVAHLDSLLDLAGELLIGRGRIHDAIGAAPSAELRESVEQLSRLVGELQREVLQARLVPVWQVFDRFPRLVRDAARSLGKEVDFVVEGKEIELDRSLLDEIGDPVMHLLRNAVDHGLEAPEERLAAGKPRQGRLTLDAVRERDAVLVRVTDDGRGIDRERVVRRARALGLLGDRDDPDEQALVRLVTLPGFSTAERVTEISGRGVGMDAVSDRLRALGGSVEISSSAGAGTVVTLRMPLTLAIVRTLLARVGDEVYALPASQVSGTAELAAVRQATLRGEPVFALGEDVVPALDLRALVGLPAGGGADRELVIVTARDRRLGLVVDELLGEQETVVKRFDPVRGGLPCFSGATVLGNGMPALIVDVGRLLT